MAQQAQQRVQRMAAEIGVDFIDQLVTKYGAGVRQFLDGQLPTKNLPPSPYRILGVELGDPPKLVEEVYRLKSKWFHPDNISTGDVARFKRLTAAHEAIKAAREA